MFRRVAHLMLHGPTTRCKMLNTMQQNWERNSTVPRRWAMLVFKRCKEPFTVKIEENELFCFIQSKLKCISVKSKCVGQSSSGPQYSAFLHCTCSLRCLSAYKRCQWCNCTSQVFRSYGSPLLVSTVFALTSHSTAISLQRSLSYFHQRFWKRNAEGCCTNFNIPLQNDLIEKWYECIIKMLLIKAIICDRWSH